MVRQDGCVRCDSNSKLVCPACPKGESCTFTVQTCNECPKASCVADEPSDSGNSGSNDSEDDGPNAGPIAGGVIGGLVVLAILTYLVWRFFIKPKRATRADTHRSVYEADSNPHRGVEKNNGTGLGRRASTHTVHSIASTVLTRASNIIQIAYIPGVTNRATPNSPDVLVPPVPPIPANHSEDGNDSDRNEQHFFVPGDLRDSTYSGFSSTTDRTSYARTSYAPRSSIASTIYGKQAQVQTASQAGTRAKPTVVSVKSNGNSTTPPVPAIDMERFATPTRPESSASTFSVGSTFLNNANTATQGRAQVVKVGTGLKKVDIPPKSGTNSSTTSLSASSTTSGDDSVEVGSIPIIQEIAPPASEAGPFADPPTPASASASQQSSANLGAIQEDKSGEKEAQKTTDKSPFSDDNATKE